jgi:hypothetical protein
MTSEKEIKLEDYQCLLLDPDKISSLQALDNIWYSHDWDMVRKDGFSQSSALFVLRCKRCSAEEVITITSFGHRHHLRE